MSQKQINPGNEFGPSQAAPLSGNKEAARVAEKSKFVRMKLSDLPTRQAKLHYLADAIESHILLDEGIGFNMATWRDPVKAYGNKLGADQREHMCHTVACIAGWTGLLEHGAEFSPGPYSAAALLDLNEEEMNALFQGEGRNSSAAVGGYTALDDLSESRAIAVIRHLADHGEVRWDLFNQDGIKV